MAKWKEIYATVKANYSGKEQDRSMYLCKPSHAAGTARSAAHGRRTRTALCRSGYLVLSLISLHLDKCIE